MTSGDSGADGWSPASARTIVVGVLALQGAFREHVQHLNRLGSVKSRDHSSNTAEEITVQAILVRNPVDLAQCSALIIPGGESTAIALGAQRSGLLEPLRDWVRDDKPTWGTCAGMIMLAREATGGKRGRQELLGGLDIRVGRNGYGSQVDSFEEHLDIPALSKLGKQQRRSPSPSSSGAFPGVFIRAPIIETLLMPEDVLAVAPDEATMVARGEGEAHEGLSIRPQERTGGASGASGEGGAGLLGRPPFLQQTSSYMSTASASSTTSSASSTPVLLAVAPPLEKEGQARKVRPPLEILSTLPYLPRGAQASVGGESDPSSDMSSNSSIKGSRPQHDSMIVALKQGRIMCTSFHPELTSDSRLHEYFLSACVL